MGVKTEKGVCVYICPGFRGWGLSPVGGSVAPSASLFLSGLHSLGVCGLVASSAYDGKFIVLFSAGVVITCLHWLAWRLLVRH